MTKRFIHVVLLLVVLMMAGCAAPTPTPTPVPPTPVPAQPTAVPPTAVPPTAVPPTAVPPTAVPPTAVPPTAVPPTAVPPTAVPPTAVPPTIVPRAANELLLATTTSTQDSGLLDVILPDFEAKNGVKVNVVAVGTGQAIQLGKDGNADVLLVHARSQEDAFMADGHGIRREDVMYNDFILVGPSADPAGIKGMKDATAALKKIAEQGATNKAVIFVSRGDKSGTHTKELAIWKAAGIEPKGTWYISAGQGMGEVLTMSAEQAAYTLSDRATYLARTKQGLKLDILVEGDKVLFNPYGVIVVNPNKGAFIKADLAGKFTDWIISVDTQKMIAEFGKKDFGQSLFVPDSQPWRDAQKAAPAAGGAAPAAGGAALKVTGKVTAEKSWTEDQLKAMKQLTAESANSQGQTEKYEGPSLVALLNEAGVAADAQTIVLVADDGFKVEVPWNDVKGCENCIVSFRSQGGLRSVLPGFPKNTAVRGLIEIQVK